MFFYVIYPLKGEFMVKKNKRGRLDDGSPNPVDVAVGKKIYNRRCELGLSMEKLASALGLTFQQIQKYEKGANRVSASRLYDISKVLGVGIDYFFADIDDAAANKSPRHVLSKEVLEKFDDPMTWEESKTLAQAYYQIEDRELARTMLELMMSISSSSDKENELF